MNLRDSLVSQLNDSGLAAISTALARLAKESIRMRTAPTQAETLSSGSSQLGGHPDLPRHFQWPQWNADDLQFVAQINVSELPVNDTFPNTGMLSFFYDREQSAWGFDPKHKDGFRLFYFPETSDLVKSSEPGSPAFPCSRLSFESALSLPDDSSEEVRNLLLELEDDEKYSEFLEEYSGPAPKHQLLGWPHIIQNPMELKCQLVTNGIYAGDPSGYKDPRRKHLEPGAADWTLLMQLDSDDHSEMMWGDAGMLYVWIRYQHLAARDFAKAWTILQCF